MAEPARNLEGGGWVVGGPSAHHCLSPSPLPLPISHHFPLPLLLPSSLPRFSSPRHLLVSEQVTVFKFCLQRVWHFEACCMPGSVSQTCGTWRHPHNHAVGPFRMHVATASPPPPHLHTRAHTHMLNAREHTHARWHSCREEGGSGVTAMPGKRCKTEQALRM